MNRPTFPILRQDLYAVEIPNEEPVGVEAGVATKNPFEEFYNTREVWVSQGYSAGQIIEGLEAECSVSLRDKDRTILLSWINEEIDRTYGIKPQVPTPRALERPAEVSVPHSASIIVPNGEAYTTVPPALYRQNPAIYQQALQPPHQEGDKI